MLNLVTTFGPRANAATSSYPAGSYKDDTSATVKDGTPVAASTGNDDRGFRDSLLLEAGYTANNLVDTALASQAKDAAKEILSRPALYHSCLEAGLNLVSGSFEDGGTVVSSTDVLWDKTDKKIYSWGGTLPKVVSSSSTPSGSGGIGSTTWIDKTNSTLKGNLSAPSGASLVGFSSPLTGASSRTLSSKIADQVSVKDFGAVGDGTADDTAAIQAAINSGSKSILFPTGTYLITSPIVINSTQVGLKLFSASKTSSASGIITNNNIEMFQDHGAYTLYEGLGFTCNNTSHSKMHIQFYSAEHPSIVNCIFNGASSTIATGSGVGFGDGSGGIGGTMGIIDRCIFNHASINVLTWDVHITNSWIWANTRAYGIKSVGAVGNLTIIGCDILPPVVTRSDRLSGIYLSGAVTQPIISACYIDGNPSLATGVGITANNGVLGLTIDSLRSNQNCQEVIVLDSVINPIVKGCTFMSINRAGLGAHGILLQQTYSQAMLNPIIRDNSFIQSAAVTGTLGSAIYVNAGVSRNRIVIEDNAIYQPGAGGGFLDQEITLVDGAFTGPEQGSLRGNSCTRKKCNSYTTAAFTTSSTNLLVNFSGTLMYPPRQDQIKVSAEGQPLPVRTQLVNANQVYFAFYAPANPGTLHVRVDLD